ncbi:ATP-binding protein [Sphingomonas sp. BN140010]|uniref:histidine kinase n=1 Tax=Sphingomonas arvum TaxID=2992113 RepID=A0ABT3JBK8_9SPHN|nr:ATP-binding protein [Sphingomonas sp. BN140010]MCW3796440.1 ATP-binding protein [Sphingomonas sp. BN140010]
MAPLPPLARALLDALEEPALLVERGRTSAANGAALALLGRDIVGRDVRLAIRQPQALAAILANLPADLEVAGLGGLERSWALQVRPATEDLLLVRLLDRSEARAAEKMRVDFVANASHELRTPLATVIGYAETLAEDGELPEPLRRRFGESIHSEALRMLRIVSDLMSLSRIEAERFVAPSQRVDLAEVAQVAADNAAPLAGSRGCTVELEAAEPAVVTGDAAQLVQLADNLVGNALRYGCSERSQLVTVTVSAGGGEAVLSVRDRGDGIAPRHLPRLTERFYRVDAARSRDSGGTGLGLAIVKHIVERHRGRLDIRSTPGRGTEVVVALPLA